MRAAVTLLVHALLLLAAGGMVPLLVAEPSRVLSVAVPLLVFGCVLLLFAVWAWLLRAPEHRSRLAVLTALLVQLALVGGAVPVLLDAVDRTEAYALAVGDFERHVASGEELMTDEALADHLESQGAPPKDPRRERDIVGSVILVTAFFFLVLVLCYRAEVRLERRARGS